MLGMVERDDGWISWGLMSIYVCCMEEGCTHRQSMYFENFAGIGKEGRINVSISTCLDFYHH